jgi:glycosyltransferase involved in cell wall biosynthesis
MYAPEGTKAPGRLLTMPCSFGKYPPSSEVCEQQCFNDHAAALRAEDVVHDFSNTQRIAEILAGEGRPTVSTLLGGAWAHPDPPRNICVWSEAMRQRGLRGATDYEGTPTPEMGGPPQRPIKDAHVVYGGIDTDWYTPEGAKESWVLWMNRWHPAKGYRQAIELARATGIELVMAGEHPDNERFEYQKHCALEAVQLAKGLSNVRFEWLPADPDHHTAKRELYRQAKALIYSICFQEPFGLSQVEALACGTPVVATNYGSVPEVVDEGRIVFVCKTMQELKEAVLQVGAINPKECRRDAVARFSRDVMAQAYLAEYQRVMNGEIWGG